MQTTSPQAIDPESYLEGAHIRPCEIDPQDMAPIDFYWHRLEQAGGNLGRSASSISSYEDALRFAAGMRQELIESGNGIDKPANPSKSVEGKIVHALKKFQKDAGGDSPADVPADMIRAWSLALVDLGRVYEGNTAPLLENISQGLSAAKSEIGTAKRLIRALITNRDEKTRRNFSFTDEDQEELEYIAQGLKVKDRADDSGENRHLISKARKKAVDKLKALSFAHAVRIGIEEGLIPVNAPLREEPAVELSDKHVEILELHSLGKSPREIARIKKIDKYAVNNHLHGAMDKLSARNNVHLVLRAFEEGILTAQGSKSIRLHQALTALEGTEAEIGLIQVYLDSFAAEKDPEEQADGQIQDNPEASSEETDLKIGRDVSMGAALKASINSSEKAAEILHATTAEVFGLRTKVLKNTYHFTPSPLDTVQQRALRAASNGAPAREKTPQGPIETRRVGILKKLGARSIVQAVGEAINNGYLAIKWPDNPYQQHPISDPKTVKMIHLISKGEKKVDIAEAMSASLTFVTHALMAARRALHADNNASLVRKSYEKGVLNPTGLSEDLHSALASALTSESNLRLAGTALSEF